MHSPRSIIAAAGALAAIGSLGVASAASAAPAIVVGNKCVRCAPEIAGKAYIPVGGVGFVPNDTATLAYTGDDLAGNVTASATGGFLTKILVPSKFINSKARYKTYALGAHSQSNPLVAASAKVHMIRIGVAAPGHRPTHKTTYRLYGFPSGKRVWAHYIFKHTRRRTVYLGHASKVCGNLHKRMRLLPTKLHYGQWHVYFSTHKTFKVKTSYYLAALNVYKVYKRAGAASAAGPRSSALVAKELLRL